VTSRRQPGHARDTITAWFDIPRQLPAGEYVLTATFPGRNGEPIRFSYPVDVR